MTTTAAAQPDDPIERLARRAGPVLVAVAFVAMLAWTWFKWPDPLVDFGRELYTAWQLSEGKNLYTDVAYFNGPFSPYFNSLVFRAGGVSLRTLAFVNIAIFALVVVMVWRLWTVVADHLGALLACLLLVTVFGFLQLTMIGNYNFITPYSHELTHGIALSLAAMLCLASYVNRPRDVALAGAGLLLGLIFLTKAEVFLAAAVALSAGLILALWSGRASPRRAMRALAQFALAMLVPPVIALVLLLPAMPWRDALRGVLGSWMYVFDPQISGMSFYRRIFGTLDPGNNVASMIESFVWWGALFGAAAAIAIALRRETKPTAQPWAFVVALVVSALAMGALYALVEVKWHGAFKGLTLVMLVTTIGLLVFIAQRRRADAPDRRLVMQFVITCFALVLLGKMLLNVLLFHYGFALAMPAMLVAAGAVLASWWPRLIDRRGGTGAILRGAAVAAVGLVIFVHLRGYHVHFADHPLVVGQGSDSFKSGDRRAIAVNLMLHALSRRPPHATLATIPEGTMINHLSRRRNPTPYVNLMPPEVLMFGQANILRAYQRRPPDYIVLVLGSDPADYGYKSFAQDYGREIYAWIESNYTQVPVPTERAYPMILLERKR